MKTNDLYTGIIIFVVAVGIVVLSINVVVIIFVITAL